MSLDRSEDRLIFARSKLQSLPKIFIAPNQTNRPCDCVVTTATRLLDTYTYSQRRHKKVLEATVSLHTYAS